MAYREVTMYEIKEVLRRWLRGASKSEIARQCGVARGTVRRYIAAGEASGLAPGQSALSDDLVAVLATKLHPNTGRPRGPSWGRCESHRGFIVKRVKAGIRLSKIRKLLRRQRDAKVSYATLWRFVTKDLGLRLGESPVPVSDGEPGKELQVDTGWVGYLSPDLLGRRRRFRAWIFTPVVSRYRFVYPVFQETTETAIEACEAAWRFYGGVFEVLIPDNTKTIVQKADSLQPTFNTTFLEYSQARGFVIDPARAGRAKDKARVERSVSHVRDDCFAGERLLDLKGAQQHALRWCREEYGMRRHGTTQRLPLEHFDAEEKPQLRPAPDAPYDVPLWCDPKVHRDQHAQVAKALYSLPREFRGRKLKARADRNTVRFYDTSKLVKVHPRVAPGKRSTDPADFPAERMVYAMRDTAFLKRKAREHGEAVGRYAEAVLDTPLPWTRMRQA
jgi:transposase